MCGIIGYTGKGNARDILLNRLSRLEYRGYDSVGIALVDKNLRLYKRGGRVAELIDLVPPSDLRTGIGHTRWATHGEAVEKNAHPHLSPNGKFAVVHNGIIENCAEIKQSFLSEGATFSSDTDSELLAHLIEKFYDGDMLSAVNKCAEVVEGAATFLVVKEGEDAVYCHRRGAALILGKGEKENVVASDMPALSGIALRAIVLDDGETAKLTPDKIRIFRDGKQILKKTIPVICSSPEFCECHMRREISEIPTALQNTYLAFGKHFPKECLHTIEKSKRIAIFACGTAYHAGLYGKELFEIVNNKPVDVFVASEYDEARFIDGDCFSIFISQSGETADTLSALEYCKTRGAKTLAVTNVAGSTITFRADYSFVMAAGTEIAVAATKSYNCQLLTLYLISHAIKGDRCARAVRELLLEADKLLRNVELIPNAVEKKLFFVGKGTDRITALEGALKFKEITYKMTDAYPSGELKHGSIALVDGDSAVIAIATNPKDKKRLSATVRELTTRGAYVAALSSVGDVGANNTVTIPVLNDKMLSPILTAIPLQLFALSTSCALGINPDKPRNLAKSVTVI